MMRFTEKQKADIKSIVLFALLFLLMVAVVAWASLSGWVDGGDPFPGTDVVPDWMEGQ